MVHFQSSYCQGAVRVSVKEGGRSGGREELREGGVEGGRRPGKWEGWMKKEGGRGRKEWWEGIKGGK